MGKFSKGQSGNPNGRAAGVKNKLTSTVKEAVLLAFNQLQEDPESNLVSWGRANPTAFYQVAAKLIPTEVSATVEATVIKVIRE